MDTETGEPISVVHARCCGLDVPKRIGHKLSR